MERNQKTHLEPDDNQANQDFSQNQINNTSRKLRRFVQNRLIDADLGQAKRSESPKKNHLTHLPSIIAESPPTYNLYLIITIIRE